MNAFILACTRAARHLLFSPSPFPLLALSLLLVLIYCCIGCKYVHVISKIQLQAYLRFRQMQKIHLISRVILVGEPQYHTPHLGVWNSIFPMGYCKNPRISDCFLSFKSRWKPICFYNRKINLACVRSTAWTDNLNFFSYNQVR